MIKRLLHYLFPPKCILCRGLLADHETDLCHTCRKEAPEFTYAKKNISFIAGWTALWYYKGKVRESLHRYKFRNERGYARIYGRLLAMHLLNEGLTDFDVLTWIPISRKRLRQRGFDQVELLCRAVGKELGREPVPTLKKHRETPPQSGIRDAAGRRANVLGAYKALDPGFLAGKRILLLDDIITTGSTASECARVLLTAGAKEVFCAAVAATEHKQNSR